MNPTEASTIVGNAEAELIKRDEELTLIAAREHQSLKHIIAIKYWLRVWDNALDKGCTGTVAIQRLIRFLATSAFIILSDRVCPDCQNPIDPSISCAEHLIQCQCLPVSSSVRPLRTFKTPFLFCPKVFFV